MWQTLLRQPVQPLLRSFPGREAFHSFQAIPFRSSLSPKVFEIRREPLGLQCRQQAAHHPLLTRNALRWRFSVSSPSSWLDFPATPAFGLFGQAFDILRRSHQTAAPVISGTPKRPTPPSSTTPTPHPFPLPTLPTRPAKNSHSHAPSLTQLGLPRVHSGTLVHLLKLSNRSQSGGVGAHSHVPGLVGEPGERV